MFHSVELGHNREVYLSFAHFNAIIGRLPKWMRPIITALHLTGMRWGEAVGKEGLGWCNVHWDPRLFRLSPSQTKKKKNERIPINRLLIPHLEYARQFQHDGARLFLIEGLRPPSENSLRKPWLKAIEELGDPALVPHPTMHDLAHTWKANARRSKPRIDYEIRETILGHGLKKKGSMDFS